MNMYESMMTGGAQQSIFKKKWSMALQDPDITDVITVVLPLISSKGTRTGLEAAMKEFSDEERKHLHVFMTGNASSHEGTIALKAYELAALGHDAKVRGDSVR
jgi:hypothetical protein